MISKKVWLRFILPGFLAAAALFVAIFVPIYIKNKNHAGTKTNITVQMRVMDFDHIQAYDPSTYDPDKFIKTWYGTKHVAKMLPYTIARKFVEKTTTANTMGKIMEQINNEQHEQVFKFNIKNRNAAGPMGRMLYGVHKSPEVLAKQTDKTHNTYWGIYEKQNSSGDWIKSSDDDYSYLSISSPNNEYARSDSHNYFDLNESFYTYDERLTYGIDNVFLSSNDILNINTWKMV